MWMYVLAPIMAAILIILLGYLSLSMLFGWLDDQLDFRERNK